MYNLLAASVSLMILGCADADRPLKPHDATLGDNAIYKSDYQGDSSREGGPANLAGCKHIVEKQCWQCGAGCKSDGLVHVGCKSPGDCALFCTPCMPASHTVCSYSGPTEAGKACLGWKAPLGSLAGCSKAGTRNGIDRYCCDFCTSATHKETTAANAVGQCFKFCSSCIPAGYTWQSKCP